MVQCNRFVIERLILFTRRKRQDMEECLGYLIGIGLAIAAVIAFIVYVVIPCIIAVAAVCLVIGVSLGLWKTSFNYIESINDAIFLKRSK